MTEPRPVIVDRGVRSSFLKVACADCGAQRIIFTHATSTIVCDVCGANIGTPSGGRLRLRPEVQTVEVLQ